MDKNILGLRTTIYVVPNLAEAKEWYSKAFRQEPYFDEPFYVGFNIAGYELGLLPEEESQSPRSSNVLSYWGVEDIEKEYKRFIKLGAKDHEKPNNVGGPIMVSSLRDPWDNVIGLIYNPAFELPE